VLELLIVIGDKFLGADDTGIGKVSGAVCKPIDFAQFKIPVSLLFQCISIDFNALLSLFGTFFI